MCGGIFSGNFFVGEHFVKSNNSWQSYSKCKTGTVNGTEYRTFIRPPGLREAHKYTKSLSCDAMLALYTVLWPCVRPSVWLGAEGPASRRRRPCGLLLQTRSSGVVGLSMRPIATDTQQWRGLTIHAAYCNWGYGRTTGWSTYRLCLAFLVI